MSENRDIAIQITGLKKRYRLGVIGGGTLQGDIQSWWAKKRGKEDPNLKIGQKEHGKNETFMALDGIDLTVYKGERLGIIGHNGAGKSTLLKLLSRVTAPTEGKICIDGRISSMLEVGTGFNPELTGRENIYLNGAILGMSRAEVDSKIDQIIEFSECGQFIDTPVKRYSSGMYVKLAFSVSAHLDSEILVMDEVLAVGDMKFQQKCLGKMGDVSQSEGRTVLYVSHNMNTIRQLCDRCIVMNKGKIIYNGNVDEAIQIYMDDVMSEMSSHINLAQIKRVGRLEYPDLMLEANIINASKCILNNVNKIQVELKIGPYGGKQNQLWFRGVVKYADKTPIGMMMSNTELKFSSVEPTTTYWEFDFKNLPEGKYIMTLSIFSMNEFGEQAFVDVVEDALKFEIIRSTEKQTINFWKHNVYGHTMLPAICEIEKI
jgi:lipopolysaccharide transport system ATP-binding protein